MEDRKSNRIYLNEYWGLGSNRSEAGVYLIWTALSALYKFDYLTFTITLNGEYFI